LPFDELHELLIADRVSEHKALIEDGDIKAKAQR
jgi:hypothetical protein